MTQLAEIIVTSVSNNIEESIVLGNSSNTNHIALLSMLSDSLVFCNNQIAAENTYYVSRKKVVEGKIVELYYERDKFKV